MKTMQLIKRINKKNNTLLTMLRLLTAKNAN